jgi:hypothetical protein
MIHPIVTNTNCNVERKSEAHFQKTDLLMWATNRVSYIYITEQPTFDAALHLWRGCHCLLWAHKAFELWVGVHQTWGMSSATSAFAQQALPTSLRNQVLYSVPIFVGKKNPSCNYETIVPFFITWIVVT